jgi:hypothetical protein
VTSAGSRHDPFAPGTYESLVHLGQRHRPQVEIPVRSLHPADRLAHTEALEVVGPEGREDLLEFLRVDLPTRNAIRVHGFVSTADKTSGSFAIWRRSWCARMRPKRYLPAPERCPRRSQ